MQGKKKRDQARQTSHFGDQPSAWGLVYLQEDRGEGQKFLDSGEVKGSTWDTSPLKLGVASDA